MKKIKRRSSSSSDGTHVLVSLAVPRFYRMFNANKRLCTLPSQRDRTIEKSNTGKFFGSILHRYCRRRLMAANWFLEAETEALSQSFWPRIKCDIPTLSPPDKQSTKLFCQTNWLLEWAICAHLTRSFGDTLSDCIHYIRSHK